MKPSLLSPQQIVINRRLRLICEFFITLNTKYESKVSDTAYSDGGDNTYLPPECVAEINSYVEANNIESADLIAIRNCPGKWHLGNPYLWLWILHRYLNHYSH